MRYRQIAIGTALALVALAGPTAGLALAAEPTAGSTTGGRMHRPLAGVRPGRPEAMAHRRPCRRLHLARRARLASPRHAYRLKAGRVQRPDRVGRPDDGQRCAARGA